MSGVIIRLVIQYFAVGVVVGLVAGYMIWS